MLLLILAEREGGTYQILGGMDDNRCREMFEQARREGSVRVHTAEHPDGECIGAHYAALVQVIDDFDQTLGKSRRVSDGNAGW